MGSLLKIWVIRYVDAEGRRISKGAPGARTIRERSSKWYGQFKDVHGKRRRTPLSKDKGAALQKLAELEREVARGKAGLIDPYAVHRESSINVHVAAYEAHLLNNEGVSQKHLKETMRRLHFVLRDCGAVILSDLRADAVENVLRSLASEQENGTKPSARARTRNTYLASARAFARWCVASGRVETDPLAPVRVLQAKKGKGRSHHLVAVGPVRRKRRPLTEPEIARLLDAAQRRPLREAMTVRTGERRGQVVGNVRPNIRARLELLGWERSLMYLVMIYTGLRRGEVAALQVCHLQLEGTSPRIELPGEMTKNGAPAAIPLRSEMVEELVRWLTATGKTNNEPVFRVPVELVKILKRDLALAGIPYKDEHGRTIDVHALRHTTATLLSRAKVPPRVAQQLMRHSDIKLTMQVYTDVSRLDETAALAAMPSLRLPGESSSTSIETGDDSGRTSGPGKRM